MITPRAHSSTPTWISISCQLPPDLIFLLELPLTTVERLNGLLVQLLAASASSLFSCWPSCISFADIEKELLDSPILRYYTVPHSNGSRQRIQHAIGIPQLMVTGASVIPTGQHHLLQPVRHVPVAIPLHLSLFVGHALQCEEVGGRLQFGPMGQYHQRIANLE